MRKETYGICVKVKGTITGFMKGIFSRGLKKLYENLCEALKKIAQKPNALVTAKIICTSAFAMYAALSVYSGIFYSGGAESESNTVYSGLCGDSEEAMAVKSGVYSRDLNSDTDKKFSSDLELLAGYISKEGKNKPYLAKLAIGAVVVNRTGTDGFPDTISEVILGLIESGESRIRSFGEVISRADSSSYSAAYSALCGADPTFEAVFYSRSGDAELNGVKKTCHIYGIDFYKISG